MPFIPAPGVIRAAIVYDTAGGNEAVNVLHFLKKAGGPVLAVDLDTVGDQLIGALGGVWPGNASNQWSILRVELRAVDVADGPILNYTASLPLAGARTSPALPDNVALCVTLPTGFAGRSRRGRLYHGGLTEDATVNNLVDQTFADGVANCWQAVAFDAGINQYPWVVVSYQTNGAPRTTAQITEITSPVVRDRRVDTMRTRLD